MSCSASDSHVPHALELEQHRTRVAPEPERFTWTTESQVHCLRIHLVPLHVDSARLWQDQATRPKASCGMRTSSRSLSAAVRMSLPNDVMDCWNSFPVCQSRIASSDRHTDSCGIMEPGGAVPQRSVGQFRRQSPIAAHVFDQNQHPSPHRRKNFSLFWSERGG